MHASSHVPSPYRLTPALISLIALLSAVAPLGIDLYLPAFTDMAHEFNTTPAAVQLTLTTFLIGLALGQLCFGPWSDHSGRRAPLFIGLSVYAIAGVVTVFAPNIGVLIVARAIQGFSGASGMVIGRAMISDLTSGKRAASAFSLIQVVIGVAPVIAPLVGSTLAISIGWRGLLSIVATIGIIGLVASLIIVKETLPMERRAAARASTTNVQIEKSPDITTGQGIRRNRKFWGFTFAMAFGFSVMMTYISASPFIYQTVIGLTHLEYGVAFGINGVGLIATSSLAVRLIQRHSTAHVLGLGILLALVASIVFVALTLLPVPPVTYVVPIFVAIASIGFILGNAVALAMSAVTNNMGLASALLGCIQFGMGAAVSPLSSLAGAHNPVPTAAIMTICAIAAGIAYLVATRPRNAGSQDQPAA